MVRLGVGKWKSLRRFTRNKKAISGLETAIVLIAFVIVASAFAYAVLNMGFLATQKSQQVVLGGLGAASSALVLDGPVYGYSNAPGPNGNLTSIIFWLKTASGASSVDLNVNETTISFQNARGVWPNIYMPGACERDYTVGGIIYGVLSSRSSCPSGAGPELPKPNNATTLTWEAGTGYQLLAGQKVRVTIDLDQLWMGPVPGPGVSGVGGCMNQMEGCQYAGEVMKNEEFYIVIKPPVGSVLEIDRVAPPAIAQVNDLG
jgi:flagellin-like protein